MQDDVANLISRKNHHGVPVPRAKGRRNIQRQLAEVYTAEGDVPDLTRLERRERPRYMSVMYGVMIALVALLLVAIAGFVVFRVVYGDSFTNERIGVVIQPPLNSISGQDDTYTITITNHERVDLFNVGLELDYPDNFTVGTTSPDSVGDDRSRWMFNVLRPGERQTVTLSGRFLAEIDSVQSLRAIVSFKPSNLNANFKQEARVDLPVRGSILTLALSGPESALANQLAEYRLIYQNTSDQPLTNIQIRAMYPAGFAATSTEPLANSDAPTTWTIKELAPLATGTIKIRGTYASIIDGGPQEFAAQAALERDGEWYIQARPKFNTTVDKDQISLQFVANGSAQDQTVAFGDTLVYSLNFKNTGQETLTDLRLIAHLDSQILDWDSLQSVSGGKRVGSTIVWTAAELPKLRSLAPGESGAVSWQIKIKDASAVNNTAVSKYNVESTAEAVFAGTSNDQTVVTSQRITHNINSDLAISASARYYDDKNIPLGSGPIQPQSGQTSSYNVVLRLSNNLHDVSDVRIVATLPKGVSWANKEQHSAGDVIYSPETNKVSWVMSRVAKTATNVQASFNINITPTKDDIGRVLVLVSDVSLSAKDLETGANVSTGVKAITTAFDDPTLGQVNGVVE